MHTQSAPGEPEPPDAPGAPTGVRAAAERSGEYGEYCSGARAMLGHLLRRWPLCWQLEQVAVCRLRGVHRLDKAGGGLTAGLRPMAAKYQAGRAAASKHTSQNRARIDKKSGAVLPFVLNPGLF